LECHLGDIDAILKKTWEEKESEEGQTQQRCLYINTSLQAISDSKSSIQVAIALNLNETEAAQYYKECWKLTQLDNLYQIYEEIKDDIGSFVKLYRLSKAAGMNTQYVNYPALKHRGL
jgi:hypothetical protein